jgi:hypothetical protein
MLAQSKRIAGKEDNVQKIHKGREITNHRVENATRVNIVQRMLEF